MALNLTPRPREIVKTLSAVTVGFILAHLLLQYLFHVHGIEVMSTLRGRLDLDHEISVPTWWAQVLLAIPALLAFLLARTQVGKSTMLARYWTLFGVLFAFLSIDEGAMVHEAFITKFREWSGAMEATGLAQHTWAIPVFILIALMSIPFGHMLTRLPSKTREQLILGLVVYVSGAVIVEILDLTYVQGDFAYQGVAVAVEEGMEMFGAILVTRALLNELGRNTDKVSIRLKQ